MRWCTLCVIAIDTELLLPLLPPVGCRPPGGPGPRTLSGSFLLVDPSAKALGNARVRVRVTLDLCPPGAAGRQQGGAATAATAGAATPLGADAVDGVWEIEGEEEEAGGLQQRGLHQQPLPVQRQGGWGEEEEEEEEEGEGELNMEEAPLLRPTGAGGSAAGAADGLKAAAGRYAGPAPGLSSGALPAAAPRSRGGTPVACCSLEGPGVEVESNRAGPSPAMPPPSPQGNPTRPSTQPQLPAQPPPAGAAPASIPADAGKPSSGSPGGGGELGDASGGPASTTSPAPSSSLQQQQVGSSSGGPAGHAQGSSRRSPEVVSQEPPPALTPQPSGKLLIHIESAVHLPSSRPGSAASLRQSSSPEAGSSSGSRSSSGGGAAGGSGGPAAGSDGGGYSAYASLTWGPNKLKHSTRAVAVRGLGGPSGGTASWAEAVAVDADASLFPVGPLASRQATGQPAADGGPERRGAAGGPILLLNVWSCPQAAAGAQSAPTGLRAASPQGPTAGQAGPGHSLVG
jgi:hypothetical protein